MNMSDTDNDSNSDRDSDRDRDRDHLSFEDKIGILDPEGKDINPLTQTEYSDEYKKLGLVWSALPAYQKASEILQSITKNSLTIIISGTGSGKSVLIPKLALHYTNYKGKIAMTLPKRGITQSAAAFAAKTLDIQLGKELGYVYKGSPKEMLNNKNRMVYMTDGTLIMKFVKDPMLTEYNVIIIDEAHERRIQIDLLLLFLKNIMLSGKRPDLRVIIMSATIDTSKYKDYFTGISTKVIAISGQPNHPIKAIFLDSPTNAYFNEGLALIQDLIDSGVKKDMLFFITTSNEALQLCRSIRPKYPTIYCIEVFSDMDKTMLVYAESRDKYMELGAYDQKLVMATNMAESSLTIDGLKYVIDSGYQLASHFDPYYFANVLKKQLITKAQALQRRGRVGRTEPGICYHLLTEQQFNNLADYPEPDILTEDITMDLLKVIQLTDTKSLTDGLKMMNQMMDPPTKPYIEVAERLYKLYNIIDSDNIITKVATNITGFSSLPINRSLFLIYAYQLHCASDAAIILAMMEVLNGKISNLFFKSDSICKSTYGNKSNANKWASDQVLKKLLQKRGDHLTFLKVYQEFIGMKDQMAWAKKYGIRLSILNTATKISKQYYYKIINLSRIPQLSRVDNADTTGRLLQALEKSHKHLIAKNLVAQFPKKKIDGQINKESTVHNFYNKKNLGNKTFIFDEFANINGSWEFNIITFI